MRVAEAHVRPSQRPLSEVAKHLVVPSEVVDTLWFDARKTVKQKLGVRFDRWQDGCGQVMLSTRANGRLACTIDGFGLGAPRQIGKTFFMTPTLFALGINRPGSLFLWTAQHSRTHEETFQYMQGFCRRPQVQPYIKRVLTGAGDEAVEFANNSRILFGARERGFGRGIPNVDGEIFDEAQILSHKALEDMLAAMNRSPLGLHVYLGTPPKPGDRCDDFTDMRDEALAVARGHVADDYRCDMGWVEFGADDDAPIDPEDPGFWPQVGKANPSHPEHTSDESILRLRKKLGPDGFRREGFGIWPGNAKTVFDLVDWVQLEDRNAEPPRRCALVVHVSEYRRTSTIAVAGQNATGAVVLLVLTGEGMSWVPGKVAELVRQRSIFEVALAPGEARGLEGDFTKQNQDVKKLSGTDISASCTALQSAVTHSAAAVVAGAKPTVAHTGQRELDGAVAKAKTKRVGPSETWEEGTESALVAAAAAFHRFKLQDAPMPGIY